MQKLSESEESNKISNRPEKIGGNQVRSLTVGRLFAELLHKCSHGLCLVSVFRHRGNKGIGLLNGRVEILNE